MTKYKVVKVSVFSYKGKTYTLGDTVKLSQEDAKRLTPSDFLEPLEEKKTTLTSAKTEQSEEPEKPKQLEKARKKS
jgi:hypothetical protein